MGTAQPPHDSSLDQHITCPVKLSLASWGQIVAWSLWCKPMKSTVPSDMTAKAHTVLWVSSSSQSQRVSEGSPVSTEQCTDYDPTKRTSVRIKLRSEVHDNGAILPKVHLSGTNSDQRCMTMDHFQQLFIINFLCGAIMKVIKIKSKFKLHCMVQMTKSLHTDHFYTLQPHFWSHDPLWPSWLRMVCGIATVASSLKAE